MQAIKPVRILVGPTLRRRRIAAGMKQSHLAELLGVHQATVSRWEQGRLLPGETQLAKLGRIFRTEPLHASHDAALRRLVEGSAQRVHLVCDRTHRLMAASKPRWAQWRLDRADLEGVCMLRFASREIARAERSLPALGWFDGEVCELEVETGPNRNAQVPVAPGRFVWQRLLLADGSVARLALQL